MSNGAVAAGFALLAAWLPAQAQWQLHGAGMQARAVVGDRAVVLAADEPIAMPAGPAAVHFPSNAAGQPASLAFEVPDGARVDVAVVRAAPARRRQLPLPDTSTQTLPAEDGSPLPTQLLLPEIASLVPLKDYRVAITIAADAPVGLVARHHEQRGCYLFCVDAEAGEARLHRFMGGHPMVLRRVALSAPLAQRVTLSLQVDGFRLRAAVDDQPVIACFDGALPAGMPGVAYAGKNPGLSTVTFEPPARRIDSAAAVRRPGAATIHATVREAAGHLAVLQLALDRPHPYVPRSAAGIEPFLRQPQAAPVVIDADWRNSLGANVIQEVGYEGTVAAEIRWPRLPALVHRSVQASFLLVTPDGEAIVARTPPVPVTF